MTTSGLLDRPRLFIDGQWREATGPSSPVLEAASEELLGRVTLAEGDDVDAAVRAARRALRGPWGSIDVQERCALLDRFADALRSRAQQTAELVSRENGMPIALSRVANGLSPAAIFRYYSRLLQTQPARDVRVGKAGRRTLVQRHPVGVVAAITPWNYPQGLAAMKLAPALATGCTVVLKPAPETGLDAYVFAEAAMEAELPAGVLNIVPGGRQTGADLVAHRDVDKVAFTGSTNAGREIGAVCGGLLRPVTLELGGKSAAILTDGADLGHFLHAAAGGVPAQQWADLPCQHPHPGAPGPLSPDRRRDHRHRAGLTGRRPLAGGHPDRSAGQCRPARPRPGLHRGRPANRGADYHRRVDTGRSAPRFLCSANGIRRRGQFVGDRTAGDLRAGPVHYGL